MRFYLRLWFKIISLEPDIINRQVAGTQLNNLSDSILTVAGILLMQLVYKLSGLQ
jgi:hypothetical protein